MTSLYHSNPDAEQYVLGCILMDDTLLRETDLMPSHFSVKRHQEIFAAMRQLSTAGKRVDYFSMPQGHVDEARELWAAIPSIKLFRHYEGLVVDAWKRRRAVEITESMRGELAETEDTSHVHEAIRELTSVLEFGYDVEYDFATRVAEVADELARDDGVMKGVSTGFDDLDTYLHGWHDEDLIIVAARPSVGKTAFALHALLHAAKLGTVCTLFAFEMRDKANIQRMLSAHGRINATRMRAPGKFFDQQDRDNLSTASVSLAQFPITIYDRPNITTAEIRTKVRAMKNKHPNSKHLVVIDYLQLMRGTNTRDKKVDQMGEISRDLKLIAREFQLPVVVLSQLNRGVESRPDKHPMMSDIRDSGSIEQDADVILLLYRDGYYDPNSSQQNVIEVNVSKQRNGRTGKVELVFLAEFNRFENLSKREG